MRYNAATFKSEWHHCDQWKLLLSNSFIFNFIFIMPKWTLNITGDYSKYYVTFSWCCAAIDATFYTPLACSLKTVTIFLSSWIVRRKKMLSGNLCTVPCCQLLFTSAVSWAAPSADDVQLWKVGSAQTCVIAGWWNRVQQGSESRTRTRTNCFSDWNTCQDHSCPPLSFLHFLAACQINAKYPILECM